MQRIDSSTTLSSVINDLADDTVTEAQRQALVQGHMDAFVGDATEGEALKRAHRVLERGLALPDEAVLMRRAVARSVVDAAAQRSPRLAWGAAVARELDITPRTARRVHQKLPEAPYAEVLEGVAGLCLEDVAAFWCASAQTAASMHAFFTQGGLEAARLCFDLERCVPNFVRLAQTDPAQIPEIGADEEDGLEAGAAFVSAVMPELSQVIHAVAGEAASDLVHLLVVRELLRQTLPEARARMLAYINSEAGRDFGARAAGMWTALGKVTAELMQAVETAADEASATMSDADESDAE